MAIRSERGRHRFPPSPFTASVLYYIGSNNIYYISIFCHNKFQFFDFIDHVDNIFTIGASSQFIQE